MLGIIKEEILLTTKKIRFIVLTALLFVTVLVTTIISKANHFNDMIFFLNISKFVLNVFDLAVVPILLISTWRRKYTRSSIIQAEEHGVKRCTAVLARALAGILILAACYLCMALFVTLLGLVFGAGLSAKQTALIWLLFGSDLISSIAMYSGCLFGLYLFAFPIVPIAVFTLATAAVDYFFNSFGGYDNIIAEVCAYIFPRTGMRFFYAGALVSNPLWVYPLICLVYVVITILLSMLVFKLKRKEKKNKKGGAEEATDAEAAPAESEAAEVTT